MSRIDRRFSATPRHTSIWNQADSGGRVAVTASNREEAAVAVHMVARRLFAPQPNREKPARHPKAST